MSDAADLDDSPPDRPEPRPARFGWPRGLRATSTRRALLLTALGGLLIAGVVTAVPIDGDTGVLGSAPVAHTGGKSNTAFKTARRGDCLMWPDGNLDAATVVDCKEDHKFEVAESVDMRMFPGSEYGPTAAPPSAARIEQITQEQCEPAVRRYLGPRFDPVGKFVTSMLWSEPAWRQRSERRMLCGLQQPGPNGQQAVFKGKVADLDQSEVWPAGTCLGIDPGSNQPTDIPVDCAAAHAMEVTGTVNLAEKFPDGLPPEPEQDAFIKDTCTLLTDEYLAPVQLRSTTLTLIYNTIALPSWSAGSREVACSIGATLGNGGWAALLNNARGQLLINGQPPVPPPDIPEERLNLPPVPMPNGGGGAPSANRPSAPQRGNQHLPQQPAGPPPQPAPPPPAPEPPPGEPGPGEPPPG